MFSYGLDPVKSFNGSGWNAGETIDFFVSDEYTIIEITDTKRQVNKVIRFRNVGQLNMQESIQFNIKEYNCRTNRTKDVSFSIPFEMAQLFIERIKTLK